MVLKSAIELDIIEIIFTATSEGGCACISVISPAKIAARIPSKNPDASVLLDRMLRLLASYDILKCSTCIKENGEVERAYSEGPTCKFLVKLKVHGFKELVDVGDGIGVAINIISSKHPHIQGTNYDLPHVIADAPNDERCFITLITHTRASEPLTYYKAFYVLGVEHVGGSDERCLKLLKNCWEALPRDGKVIIVESILPVAPENIASSHIVFEQDLLMLARNPGG
ncbi:hypothetical protein H0E87_004304 [Populus deltoides]|uniref:O-methyltransferase C-terminal domain-containing protein n=1 Tax=Populus deltoides TaxID=3696 RepID=A0A8T2ZED4_POPDE|nr:hypothetical protein H0E87_004304 [Populus deltoides]